MIILTATIKSVICQICFQRFPAFWPFVWVSEFHDNVFCFDQSSWSLPPDKLIFVAKNEPNQRRIMRKMRKQSYSFRINTNVLARRTKRFSGLCQTQQNVYFTRRFNKHVQFLLSTGCARKTRVISLHGMYSRVFPRQTDFCSFLPYEYASCF